MNQLHGRFAIDNADKITVVSFQPVSFTGRDEDISDEQRMLLELARSIARDKIAPVAAHHDETETYPEEPMRLLAQQGLMGIWLPEAYGGTNMGAMAVALVAEEIAWACAARAVHTLGTTPKWTTSRSRRFAMSTRLSSINASTT
jgi:alkylation response protein AidB-like acyl-CoA dehydrogenase